MNICQKCDEKFVYYSTVEHKCDICGGVHSGAEVGGNRLVCLWCADKFEICEICGYFLEESEEE